MTDYAPLPLREPVRSLVWIRGRLHHVPTATCRDLLDLIAAENPNPALLQVNTGSRDVAAGDTPYALCAWRSIPSWSPTPPAPSPSGSSTLLDAQPDPFCALESCWLQHLESAHRDVVDRLADRLPTPLRRGHVRPLGLDRYGVQLRVESDDGDHDVRLPFAKPVDDVTGPEPGHPGADGLPVPQRPARPPHLSGRQRAATVLGVTGPPDELRPPHACGRSRIEIVVVLAVTFGLSRRTRRCCSLIEAVLLGLSGQQVALNRKLSPFDLIDLGLNLASVVPAPRVGRCWACTCCGAAGSGPAGSGSGGSAGAPTCSAALGLAALIGMPGLGLYVAGRALGIGVAVVPSELGDTWWRIPVLLAVAFANGWAEEVIVVAFLMTRLRQLGMSPVKALVISSLLRGAYHLYQGFGAGLGNVVMGLVFGYVWQRTGRLWPLIIAHGLIDAVAFVGYALAAGHLGWLR